MKSDKRGSVLLMCFYIVAALAMIGAAFGLVMVNERLAVLHHTQSVQALYLADAGLQKAVYDLRQDYINSGNWNDGDINGIAVVPAPNQFYPLYNIVNLGAGTYSVELMNDGSAMNEVWVKSTGTIGQTQKTVEAYIKVSNPVGPVLSQTGWLFVNN